MPNPDDLLTSPQVSYLLGVSTRTVHRMVAAGTLRPAQQLPGPNGAFLFRRAAIERIAAQDIARVGAA